MPTEPIIPPKPSNPPKGPIHSAASRRGWGVFGVGIIAVLGLGIGAVGYLSGSFRPPAGVSNQALSAQNAPQPQSTSQVSDPAKGAQAAPSPAKPEPASAGQMTIKITQKPSPSPTPKPQPTPKAQSSSSADSAPENGGDRSRGIFTWRDDFAFPGANSGQGSGNKVYYADCDAVRAAGVKVLRIGDPGYRFALDRNLDGYACNE